MLKVGGLVPFTAVDYPGKLAAVVFVQGCPWRCDYCHNPHLQGRAGDTLAWAQVLARLQRRVGLLDAVVFSGGEPLTDPHLKQAMCEVRALGFRVGLHTAGTRPERLQALLPLLDWVGLDIKAPFADYQRITHVAHSGERAQSCLQALIAGNIAYECRTTAHPRLLPEPAILALAQTLAHAGVDHYALQVFRAQGCHDTQLPSIPPGQYPSEKLIHELQTLFSDFTLRRA